MYTRSMFATNDIDKQSDILNEVADMLDSKVLKPTLTTVIEGFTVENLKKAHQLQESGKSIGKTVITF